MFFDRNSKPFLSNEETELVLTCIRENEKSTSGEIRLCIESKCKYVDPIERARELFIQLKMYNTTDRNAVLIYIAYQDKDFALFSDAAIFNKASLLFWQKESKRLSYHFFHHQYVEGITECVTNVGDELKKHFPWEGEKKNELPDEIIFGK